MKKGSIKSTPSTNGKKPCTGKPCPPGKCGKKAKGKKK